MDIAGSGIIPELITLTGNPATVLSIADFAATQHGAQLSFAPADPAAAYAEAAALFEHGHFRLPVAKTFPRADAADAQAANATGHVAGRIVITAA